METVHRKFTIDEVIALLNSRSPKCEAALLVVKALGECRTSDVAAILGWDRANTGRRLEDLAEDGLVELVEEAHHDGKRGRPSRLWAAV